MSGRLGDLSPQQEEALEKFRTMVAGILEPHQDDYFLLRWLRARKFDVRKSKAALCKSLAWRKKMGADTLLEDYVVPEVYEKCFPGGHFGFDKEGFPVRYVPFASDALDFDGGVKCNTLEGHMKYVTYLIEEDIRYSREISRKLGKVIDQQTYIIDVKDCSLRLVFNKKALQLLYNAVRIYEDNYPEQLKKVFIINFSPLLVLLYKIAKSYLDENVFKKFQFFSTDAYKEALLEVIDADVLPMFLGGNRVDPDGNPRCPSLLKPGGVIDPKYFLKRTPCSDSVDETHMKSTVVPPKSEAFVEVEVGKSDATIQCEVLTKNYDIGLGLMYRPSVDSDLQRVTEPERVECCHFPLVKEFHCQQPGTYLIHFDNKYSWFRQKGVKYRIEVTPPSY